MSQPPSDPPPPAGQSGEQPTYGQPTYDQPTYGQPSYPDPQQQYGQPPGWSQPTAAQYGSDIRQTEAGYAQMYGQKQRTGLAIAALVLGILGLIASPWPFGSYLAVLLSLLAVIFGIIAVRRPIGKGMAIAGLILGGLALIISIIASIFWTGVIVDVVEITQQCIDDTGTDQGPAFRQCVDDRSRNYNPFD